MAIIFIILFKVFMGNKLCEKYKKSIKRESHFRKNW